MPPKPQARRPAESDDSQDEKSDDGSTDTGSDEDTASTSEESARLTLHAHLLFDHAGQAPEFPTSRVCPLVLRLASMLQARLLWRGRCRGRHPRQPEHRRGRPGRRPSQSQPPRMGQP